MKTCRKNILITTLIIIVGILFSSCGVDKITKQLNLGYKYLNEGQYEEAILAFDKVLVIDEKNTKAIIGTASAYVGLEQFDEATSFLTEHISNNKENKELYDKLIEIYLDRGMYAEAKEIIDMAAEMGYLYDVDSLEADIKEKLLDSSEYQTAWEEIEINNKRISVKNGNVQVTDLETGIEENIAQGNYASNFMTDGNIVYLFNSGTKEIAKAHIGAKTTTKIIDTYTNIPSDAEEEWGWDEITFLGCNTDYLYYSESYAFENYGHYAVDLRNYKIYKMDAESYANISTFMISDEKIYYRYGSGDWSPSPVYSADVKGQTETELLNDVMRVKLSGGKIYYTQIKPDDMYSGNGEVRLNEYDINTNDNKILDTIIGNGGENFSAFNGYEWLDEYSDLTNDMGMGEYGVQ